MPTTESLQIPINRPFRILSLDGGGSKGVYSLGVLREVEAILGAPLSGKFDLIFGTSTGSIIGSMLALGYGVDEIEKRYFDLIPEIMTHSCKGERTQALIRQASVVFGDQDFTAFKTSIGIVCSNYRYERPMIFKASPQQAHGMTATFKPGFGCKIADAVVASSAAYPFFEMREVETENQGSQLLVDGGYVANNPTLFAIADATNAFGVSHDNLQVLSIGVGHYLEPKKSIWHQIAFRFLPLGHLLKLFNTSSSTVETLRRVLFPNIQCIRIDDTFHSPEYATDFLDNDIKKLRLIHSLGRESFAKLEGEFRRIFQP